MLRIADWRKAIHKIAGELASRDFQERSWFGFGDYFSSPEEMYCQLFDDFQFDAFLDDLDNGLTDEQRMCGRELANALSRYSERIGEQPIPEKVINDPDWAVIRTHAEAFCRSLESSEKLRPREE